MCTFLVPIEKCVENLTVSKFHVVFHCNRFVPKRNSAWEKKDRKERSGNSQICMLN